MTERLAVRCEPDDLKIHPFDPVDPYITNRRRFAVGQVWAVDVEAGSLEDLANRVLWLVLTPTRVIALFSGASDHTPASLYNTYGDRLWLWQNADVYASTVTAK